MRLHAYLAQALLPGKEQLKFAQLPNIKLGERQDSTENVEDFVGALEEKGDERVKDVKRALDSWGRLEVVDATFKGKCAFSPALYSTLLMLVLTVIGERLVTPSAIVYLVVKLRLSPPRGSSPPSPIKEKDVEETKRLVKLNDEKDYHFLTAKNDVEEPSSNDVVGWAHAPYWPGVCLSTHYSSYSVIS